MSRPTIPTGKLAPCVHPRLKLFLSADIVGSTAHKQPFDISLRDATTHLAWPRTIQAFYSNMVDQVEVAWRGLRDEFLLSAAETVSIEHFFGDTLLQDGSDLAKPRLWKTIGDEVIFWKTLTHEAQLWTTLACWQRAMPKVREELRRDGAGLNLKCTAWLAGFPVRNRAIYMRSQAPQAVVPGRPYSVRPGPEESAMLDGFYSHETIPGSVDFIGPGIDVGFRIAPRSTSRQMAVSLDVAYLLALSRPSFRRMMPSLFKAWFEAGRPHPVRLVFHGADYLKGVLGGLRYPFFSIAMDDANDLEDCHDRLIDRPEPAENWDKIVDYGDRFYIDHAKYLSPPFVNHADSETTMPKGYARALVRTYRALNARRG